MGPTLHPIPSFTLPIGVSLTKCEFLN
ncbi:TPA: hypothetical protein QC153_002046 [Bacillus cereus]|nr:hypothetical protein [Bacillus cereus]HDR8302702.1 hypothetical protein [Bacillus cereus]HDR8319702.1 hypothetical protein [Bacillus cereus]HDR8325959.1 hypothetical protein [Bacillus cereus]HDR8335183.1 hypothetical protein [Bacillus cereus]